MKTKTQAPITQTMPCTLFYCTPLLFSCDLEIEMDQICQLGLQLKRQISLLVDLGTQERSLLPCKKMEFEIPPFVE